MQNWKKFIQYYKPYVSILIIDLFCAAIVSCVDLVYPQVLRFVSGNIFTQDGASILAVLPKMGLAILAAYLIQMAAGYYVSFWGHKMGAMMERDMRAELFEHYEKLSFSYYDRNNSGQMMSRLVSDLNEISELAHHGPENLFISLLKICGSLYLMFRIHARLSLIIMGLVVTIICVSYYLNEKMNATWADNRVKLGNINATLQDSFSGIRIVQAFANEKVEREKFKVGNEGFLKSKFDNYKIMGIYYAADRFLLGLMYATTLVGGGFFIAKGQMSVTDLAMFSLYIGVFLRPIDILIELTEMLQKGYSGFKRFRDVMDTEPEIKDADDAEDIKNPRGDIAYNHVSFKYLEDEEVLNDVNFTVTGGKSVAFAGPSGGGKTTVCSLLPRFYDVGNGSITIGGQDIRKIKLESLRGSIGIVQQDVYMFGGTVRENIEYGKPGASDEEIIEAAKKAKIHEFIMSLPNGYDTIVGERGARLSGGQKQRISIARVFLKNPPILIFDEATSALDNESEAYIRESLRELSKGRTTITIAHRLSTIRDVEEILVIDDHKVQERGNHAELMAKDGIYAKYYNMQFEGL